MNHHPQVIESWNNDRLYSGELIRNSWILTKKINHERLNIVIAIAEHEATQQIQLIDKLCKIWFTFWVLEFMVYYIII